MQSIAPCRSQISDRFPIASFDIALPQSGYYEVVCATDPRLLHTQWRQHRTQRNFFTSRNNGLLPAPNGRSAFFVPPEQLKRFAGARRIYYALASYGSPTGTNPQFSISPDALDQVPSIAIAPDFTGRTLDRTRLPGAPAEELYGSPGFAASLRWGGDDFFESENKEPVSSAYEYDDGHSPELWQGDGATRSQASGLDDQSAYDDGIAQQMSADYSDALGEDGSANDTDQDAQGQDPAGSYGFSDNYDSVNSYAADSWGSAPYGGAEAFADDSEVESEYGESFAAGGDDDDVSDDDSYGSAEADALDHEQPYVGEEESQTSYEQSYESYEQSYDSSYDSSAQSYSSEEVNYGGAGADLDGYEDAAALYGAVGYASEDGSVAVAEPEKVTDAEAYPSQAAAFEVGAGRDPGYRADVAEEDELPPGAATRALAALPLEIADKVRIVRVIAQAESGADGYSAINPDNEYNDPNHPAYRKYHIGLSWGLIQFTQRSGSLGRVLSKIKEREDRIGASLPAEQRFAQLFGPHADELLRVTNAATEEGRVAAVGGANLWEPVWTARFRAAGRVPHVQYAQNEVALTDYFDPNLRVASWLGLDTPRALAMLVDRCIHMGNGGGISWIMRSCGPIQTQADRDNALRALGHADLRAFQSAFGQGLSVDGRWGPRTHAALTCALRNLGSRSPIAIPTRDAFLQRIVDAARGTRFQRRVTALQQNRTDFADDTIYALG